MFVPGTPNDIIVNENETPGHISNLNATDQDNGKAGEVSYYIENSANTFNITLNTGQLVTLKSLDREERSNYMITIVARDNAPSPFFLETRKNILVYVGDKNDNAPTFHGDITKYFVDETLSVGSIAFIVQASDLDSGSNADIVYAVVATNDSLNNLQIDQNNGSIIVRCKFTLYFTYFLLFSNNKY